jgi:hypothetical protein
LNQSAAYYKSGDNISVVTLNKDLESPSVALYAIHHRLSAENNELAKIYTQALPKLKTILQAAGYIDLEDVPGQEKPFIPEGNGNVVLAMEPTVIALKAMTILGLTLKLFALKPEALIQNPFFIMATLALTAAGFWPEMRTHVGKRVQKTLRLAA